MSLSGAEETAPIKEEYGWICQAGHYCPAGTNEQVQCPIGTFNLNNNVSYCMSKTM